MGFPPLSRGSTHPTKPAKPGSVGGEAVKQATAAGAAQVVLAATTIGSARWVRRVPGFRGGMIPQPLAVDVPEHRGAFGAAGPVDAGAILAGWKSAAVHLRAGQGIV